MLWNKIVFYIEVILLILKPDFISWYRSTSKFHIQKNSFEQLNWEISTIEFLFMEEINSET